MGQRNLHSASLSVYSVDRIHLLAIHAFFSPSGLSVPCQSHPLRNCLCLGELPREHVGILFGGAAFPFHFILPSDDSIRVLDLSCRPNSIDNILSRLLWLLLLSVCSTWYLFFLLFLSGSLTRRGALVILSASSCAASGWHTARISSRLSGQRLSGSGWFLILRYQ